MRKTSKANKSQQSALDSLRGGKLPESVARRLVAEIRRNRIAELEARSSIRQQAAKYFEQIRKPIASDGKAVQAISGLRGVTDRLAKQKLTLPAYQSVLGGIVAGSYTLRFTPPYTTQVAAYTYARRGHPTTSASLDPNQGQMRCSVVTDYNSPSEGGAHCAGGIYFRPMFGPAIVVIRVDFETSFQWAVNSLGPSVGSIGQCLVQVHRYDANFTLLTVAPSFFWLVETFDDLDFDWGSEVFTRAFQVPVTLSSNYFYFVTVTLHCHAHGAGWPGSVAVAEALVRVPSITVEVTYQPQNA